MDISGFLALRNRKVLDRQGTSFCPDVLLWNDFSGSTVGSFLPQRAALSDVSFPLCSCYSASSSISFSVFTLKKKYNTWQIQTTIRQILPIGTFFIHKNPSIIQKILSVCFIIFSILFSIWLSIANRQVIVSVLLD